MVYAIIGVVVFLLLFLFVYTRQPKNNRVSLLKCLIGFGLGAIPAFFAAFYFQIFTGAYVTKGIENPMLKMFVEYFLIVAGSEELAKFLCGMLLLKNCKRRIDYVVVFAAVGIGFEIFESVLQINDLSGLLIKGLLSLHVCFQIFMGSLYGRGNKWLALIVPWVIHGAYDFMLSYSTGQAIVGSTAEKGALTMLGVVIGGITLLVLSLIYAHYIGKKCKQEEIRLVN